MARTFFSMARLSRVSMGRLRKSSTRLAHLTQGLREGGAFFVVGAFNGCGIGEAPVRGDRLAGPEGTHFAGGLVADGDDKVELRCAGGGELVPAFAAQVFDWVAEGAHLLDGEGVDAAGGMAAGAVGLEAAGGHGVEERLADDAARGVAGAEDEDVVGLFAWPSLLG